MKYTKTEILKKIKSNDVKFFQELFLEGSGYSESELEFKQLWEINWGDGNDWKVALNLTDFDITILLEGYYSSHGDSEFDHVSLSVPYEFKEKRYRKATEAEIRDLKIDEIFN